jgi:hypothetical protein
MIRILLLAMAITAVLTSCTSGPADTRQERPKATYLIRYEHMQELIPARLDTLYDVGDRLYYKANIAIVVRRAR